MALSGTTQLEAVNTLLHTIGEAPVNSLTGTLPIDATLALNTINEISREVQSAGWHWNTFYKYALSLDGDSKIPLASNIMRVDLNTGEYPLSSYDVIKRGSFLYNKQGNTFVFDEAVEANVIIYLPFEELMLKVCKACAEVFVPLVIDNCLIPPEPPVKYVPSEAKLVTIAPETVTPALVVSNFTTLLCRSITPLLPTACIANSVP